MTTLPPRPQLKLSPPARPSHRKTHIHRRTTTTDTHRPTKRTHTHLHTQIDQP
uniref:Uncharacterized protein n=1 Tax=Anguilla anguilla TaxID=7936 RepID=A0A0E9S9M0_ANGAN